jgi:hypothetical protein
VLLASVIYVLLQNKLVVIAGFSEGATRQALIWVAAFLCGFQRTFRPGPRSCVVCRTHLLTLARSNCVDRSIVENYGTVDAT